MSGPHQALCLRRAWSVTDFLWGGGSAGSDDGPTRLVALVPLSNYSDTAVVEEAFLKGADVVSSRHSVGVSPSVTSPP